MDTNRFFDYVKSSKLIIYADCKKIYKKINGIWYEATSEALNDDTCKKYYGVGIYTDSDIVPKNNDGENNDVYVNTANKVSFSMDNFGMLRVTFEDFSVRFPKWIYFFSRNDVQRRSLWKGNTEMSALVLNIEPKISLMITESGSIKLIANDLATEIKRLP